MPYYRVAGEIPRKRHTRFRRASGELSAEELMGAGGFSSDSALLYDAGVPSAIVDSRPWALPDLTTTPNHPLRPRHLRLHELAEQARGDHGTAARRGRRRVRGPNYAWSWAGRRIGDTS